MVVGGGSRVDRAFGATLHKAYVRTIDGTKNPAEPRGYASEAGGGAQGAPSKREAPPLGGDETCPGGKVHGGGNRQESGYIAGAVFQLEEEGSKGPFARRARRCPPHSGVHVSGQKWCARL